VSADPTALEGALVSLVSNAVTYTPDGGEVTLSARGEGATTIVEVTDTGCGIPEDEQSELFTRFYRGSVNRDLAIDGTGLGLAICRAIVEAHSGTIRVHSRVEEGTKVVLTLPTGG
jgi:signal transduction histidine kinase